MRGEWWVGSGRGFWVALTTPVWLRADRLQHLMVEGATGRASTRPVEPAVRAARAALARLARIPFSPWRNTCLYRSIAICRCLRDAGIPARIRIGVSGGEGSAAAADRVAAHAWVESGHAVDSGLLEPEPDGAFAPLRPRTGERP